MANAARGACSLEVTGFTGAVSSVGRTVSICEGVVIGPLAIDGGPLGTSDGRVTGPLVIGDATIGSSGGRVTGPLVIGDATIGSSGGRVTGPSTGVGVLIVGGVVGVVETGAMLAAASAYGSIGRMSPDGPAGGAVATSITAPYGSIGCIELDGPAGSARVARTVGRGAATVEANGKSKRKDDYLWKELYQDAITDTWTGEVSWDPYKAPLELHLRRVIRSRTSRMMKHLTRFPRVSTYGARLDLELEMSESMAADRASERGVDLRGHVDDVIAELYRLASGDGTVIKILDCFGQGVIDRRDIVRATGMPAPTYDSARRRLLSLVESLPQDLRDEAIRAMA